jgi:hypothetical protein
MQLAFSRRLPTFAAALLVSVGPIFGPGGLARAADTNAVDTPNDARLDVYPAGAGALVKNSDAVSVWLLFLLIGAITLGFLFWDPSRKNLE